MQLTPRDVAIIEAVYRYRVLTSHQIERLCFATTSSAQVRLRLNRLFHHEFLYRSDQPVRRSEGTKPYLYFLDTRGAQELASLFGCAVNELDWSRRDREMGFLHLPHLLLSNDIRIAVTQSAAVHGYTVEEWRIERTLRRLHRADLITVTLPSGEQQTTHVIPDGYFLLQVEGKRKHRFIEVDRATVTGRTMSEQNRAWNKKVGAYLAWHRSGKYKQRYRAPAFGVLTITTTEERLSNLKRITEEVGGKQHFWFTCLSRLEGQDFFTAPIWTAATTNGSRSIVEAS